MKKFVLLSATILFCLNTTFAQDPWLNNVIGGFDSNNNNKQSNGLNVYNNQLYAATGSDSGYVYRTTTGQKNAWQKVFSQPNLTAVTAISSTSSNFYVSGYFGYNNSTFTNPDSSIIYRSVDGSTNWTPYFEFAGSSNFIIPFKGTGAVDSIYVVKSGANGSEIWKNDQLNTTNTWTQSNFINNEFLTITSNSIHNNKLYIGTNQSSISYKPTLWSTADGNSWTQENTLILDTAQFSSMSISAMVSFNNELYIGTENYSGAQIWGTSDFITWNLVATYPTCGKITNLQVISTKLCASLQGKYIGTGMNSPAIVINDVTTNPYNYSTNNGFGILGLDGTNGSTIEFGNNMYYACSFEFMGTPDPNQIIAPNGSQIWKLCLLTTPPTVNLGPDITVCAGVTHSFDAGTSGVSYVWTDGSASQTLDTNQLLTVSYPQNYIVTVMSSNGCEVSDTVTLKNIPSPTNSGNFYDRNTLLCKGDTVQLPLIGSSNLRITGPTVQSNLTIPFYGSQTIADTLMVNIAPDEWAGNSIVSVTIDSLVNITNNGVLISLQPPYGSPITLSNYGYGNNYVGTTFTRGAGPLYNGTAPYSGSFSPIDSLYNLSGSTNGGWILQITDTGGNNIGYLKGWSLTFSQQDTVVTYSWAPTSGLLMPSNAPSLLASPQASTTYTLTVTNQIGCSSSDSALVEVPRLEINQHLPHICFGGSDSLSATIIGLSNFGQPNPLGYHWSSNAGLIDSLAFGLTVTPNNTTTYYVADTISTGCPIHDTTVVNVSPAITADAGVAQTICYGDTATITASASGGTSPLTYTWYEGSNSYTGQTISVSSASPATYTYSLTVTDNWACSAGSSTSLTVMQSADIYGHVDSLGLSNIVNGEVVIYKYQSYLTHFDSINAAQLDANGNYHFSTIIQGTYLIKVFPNSATYQTSVPTYFGNNFLWTAADTINHDCSSNDTANISVIFTPTTVGPGALGGLIREGLGFSRQEGDPIPGLDVKLGKNPGGQIIASTQTDNNGYYYFDNLSLNNVGESYIVYADIPGLGRDSSYNVVLDPTHQLYDSLNYLVDSTTIYIVPTSSTGINTVTSDATTHFSVYPNPFKGNASIEYNIFSEADVTLEVLNVLGVKIKALVNSRQSAGNHKCNLNNQIVQLSSGVYFITLTIDGKASTQRIVVME